jgi:putative transcriptional regulator
MSKFFDDLMESVQEMNPILRGERQASRAFTVDALQVKEIRKATGLTQAEFAALTSCNSTLCATPGPDRVGQGPAESHS